MPMPGDTFMADRLETFDSLRDRITARYDDLSPHLQRLARIALEDPNSVALETVAAIAARVGVQPSTLIRFAKEFGYSGFSQMQKIFKLRHEARNAIDGLPHDHGHHDGKARRDHGKQQSRDTQVLVGPKKMIKAGQRAHPIAVFERQEVQTPWGDT